MFTDRLADLEHFIEAGKALLLGRWLARGRTEWAGTAECIGDIRTDFGHGLGERGGRLHEVQEQHEAATDTRRRTQR